MRPVLPADLEIAMRVLLSHAPRDRPGLIQRIIAEADIADRYRKRLGRCHPRFGTGTLMSAAYAHDPGPTPDWCDPAWLSCLGVAVHALIRHKQRQNL